MKKELIQDKNARFYASIGGKMFLLLLSFLFVVTFLDVTGALTLSCSISTTCPYPSIPLMYVQNDTGGYDNAHAQNSTGVSLEGLVGWYRLDNDVSVGESTSTVFDWSGNGNNGSVTGAVSTSAGKLSGAYSFDGNLDYVSVPYSSSLAPQTPNLTVVAWFYSASLAGSQRIISKTETGGYQLSINENSVCTSNSLCMTIYNGTTYYQASTPVAGLSAGIWYHVVGTYNGTQMTLYLNGEPVGTNTQIRGSVRYSYSNPFCIGSEPSSAACTAGSYFNGSIDDVMVFNRSLSPSEVSALYNRQYSTYNYALCCSSPDASLSNGCTQSNVTRLSNYTNAHVQATTYSGTAYSYPTCLASSPGKVQCTYSDTSCSAPYTCIGSMASSELADANQTNSHIASCNTYKKKICCKLNTPPVVSNVVINSTLGTNYTTENLSVYFSQVDADSDFMTNITDWRVNGNSIAVLNMPFNTEESSTAANALKDYSSFGNNGTLGGGSAANSPTWVSSGVSGGSYAFNGSINDDYIWIDDRSSLDSPDRVSFSIWIKPEAYGTYYATHIINKWTNTNDANYVLYFFGNYTGNNGHGNLGVYANAGGAWKSLSTVYSRAPLHTWTHVAWTYSSATGGQLYINGAPYGVLTGNGALATNNQPIKIDSGDFDGFMDELQIFNKTLSANQVKEIYLAGLAGMSIQKIHSDETSGGETWSCSITANDGRDGNTLMSNNLTIRDSLPTVELTSPPDGNATTNRTPRFEWIGTDLDGDTLTYEINLTAVLLPGGASTCSDVITATTANQYYIPTRELACLRDNGMVYQWSVRANDGGGYGDWSQVRTLNVTALLAISLPVNTIEFGSMRITQSNDTTDESPEPFVVQNDGNSLQNINVTATQLWQSASEDSQYYQYKVRNMTGEEGAFNWSGSTTVFANLSSSEKVALNRLNHSNIRDSAKFDVRVQVPPNEPPALRNSTVTFMAILGEK